MPIYPEFTYEWAVSRLQEIMEDAASHLERYKKPGFEIPADTHYPHYRREWFDDYDAKRDTSDDHWEFEMHYRAEFDCLTDSLADGDFPFAESWEWTKEELEDAGQMVIEVAA